jgi:hypothetical protein
MRTAILFIGLVAYCTAVAEISEWWRTRYDRKAQKQSRVLNRKGREG